MSNLEVKQVYRRTPSCKVIYRALRGILDHGRILVDITPYYPPDQSGVPATLKRCDYTKKYSWAVPNDEAIDAIVSFANGDTIVEVGAGHGLWASLISKAGGNIIATDNKEWYQDAELLFCDVISLNADKAVKKYNPNVLMICWPCYESPMAIDALKLFNGDRLIYIGEQSCGCTGDASFHEEIFDRWEIVREISIPKFLYIHDSLYLYKKKS